MHGNLASLTDSISERLDARIAFQLPIVIAGMILAGGRRTVASWFRAAGVKDDWDRFYDLLASVGRGATTEWRS